MEKIYTELPDQLDYEFRSEWIDSYSSVVQSMRFRDLGIWITGSHPASGLTVNLRHDFFPQYEVYGGGIPLLVSEDGIIHIERRGIDTEEPRYSLFFDHRSSSLIFQVYADFDSPDIESCGGETSVGSSK